MSVAVGSPDQLTLEAGCNVYTLTGRPDDQGFWKPKTSTGYNRLDQTRRHRRVLTHRSRLAHLLHHRFGEA